MKTLTDHICPGNEVNEKLKVFVLDEPGPGGAHHEYAIRIETDEIGFYAIPPFKFQDGPIKEVGVNGATVEALIAICIDRLRDFQAGPFKSGYNQGALGALETAMEALHQRTKDRLARGVEGQLKP